MTSLLLEKQTKIVELLKTRGELNLSKKDALKYADKIAKLSPEKFDELMKIAFKHNCYGTTCYKFLNDLN